MSALTSRLQPGILSIAVLLSSCLLQSPESDFHNISKSAPDGSHAVQYSYDEQHFDFLPDTLTLTDRIYFSFLPTIVPVIQVTVDGSPVDLGAISSIWIGEVVPGIHALKITQKVPSTSGSLAASAGQEFDNVVSSAVLVVPNPNDIYTATITNVEVVDGTVKITFPKYTKHDFVSYQITMSTYGSTVPFNSITTTDINMTTITDHTYVGGIVNYQLTVKHGASSQSDYYFFSVSQDPKFQTSLQPDGKHQVTWSGLPFNLNIASYDLKVGEQVYQNINTSASLADVEGILPFGSYTPMELTVHSIPGGDNNQPEAYIYLISFMPGKTLPYLYTAVHDPVEPYFYVFATSPFGGFPPASLYKINDVTFEVVASIENPSNGPMGFGKILISPDGQYHYLLSGGTMMKFDPLTLIILDVSPITSLQTQSETSTTLVNNDNQFGITNNNLFLFRTGDDGVFVVDMNSKTTLFHYFTNSLGRNGHISADGKYLAATNGIYVFQSGSYQVNTILSYTDIIYQQYLNNNSHHLLVLTKNSAVIFDCDNNQEIVSYPLPAIDEGALDQLTSRVLLRLSGGGLRVLDLTTGSLSEPDADSSFHYLLQDGTLILLDGPTAPDYTYGYKIF